MWPSRDGDHRTVTCIACGATLDRGDAREYDKEGNRWHRDGKQFEYLCKPCFGELSKDAGGELESLCVEAGAGSVSREQFLRNYLAAVGARDGEDTGTDSDGRRRYD